MAQEPTHQARVKLIHSGRDGVVYDVAVRPLVTKRRTEHDKSPTEIHVRISINQYPEGALDTDPPEDVRDRRYILRETRKLLLQASSGPWSEQDSATIYDP